MTPHDLLANFEVLAEAPNGIQRLRELVLELAVRGKLVEQDPEDSPPIDFLMNLERLRNRGTRSKSANPELPLIPGEAAPFIIPSSWVWTKFEFTHINRDSERIPLSRDERSGKAGPYDYYGASGVIDKIDSYIFDGPLLLLGEDGANLVLRSTPIAFIAKGKYWVNNHAHVLDSPSEFSLRYLAIFLNQCDLKPYLTGTAQPKLNQARMNSIPCPFPPLLEQHRIVARVDELMALLDRLEAKRQEREAARTAARDSALAALREAPTPDDVETAWLRIQERFHELFATPEDVEPLRQAILQLAVRGRLVHQDATDLPVSPRSDRTGRRMVARAGSTLGNDAVSPDLPLGWILVSLQDILREPLANGRSVPDGVNGYPVLRLSALRSEFVNMDDFKIGNWTESQAKPFVVQAGDFLVARGNGSKRLVGRGALVQESANVAFPDTMIRIRLEDTCMNASYFRHVWDSDVVRSQIETKARTTSGIFKVSQENLEQIVLPVPPIREQARILAVVESLFAATRRLQAVAQSTVEMQQAFAAAAAHHLDA